MLKLLLISRLMAQKVVHDDRGDYSISSNDNNKRSK